MKKALANVGAVLIILCLLIMVLGFIVVRCADFLFEPADVAECNDDPVCHLEHRVYMCVDKGLFSGQHCVEAEALREVVK